MKAQSETEAFSRRLNKALKDALIDTSSPTLFAREFNRRFSGRPVTTYAVRKWLLGESIPSQDKLRLLAVWTGVSTEWLRFGDGMPGDKFTAHSDHAHYNSPDMNLFSDIGKLNAEHKTLLREMVLTLLRLENK